DVAGQLQSHRAPAELPQGPSCDGGGLWIDVHAEQLLAEDTLLLSRSQLPAVLLPIPVEQVVTSAEQEKTTAARGVQDAQPGGLPRRFPLQPAAERLGNDVVDQGRWRVVHAAGPARVPVWVAHVQSPPEVHLRKPAGRFVNG